MRDKALASALVLASVVVVGTAAATPATPIPMNSLAFKSVTTSGDLTKIRWSRWRGGWHGPRPFIGGFALGGAIAAPYYGYPYAYGGPYWAYPYGSSSICREGIWRRAVPCSLP